MRRRIPALVILLAASTHFTARAQLIEPATAQIGSASSCIFATPVVTVSAVGQSVGAGATVHYDVTVTNHDSPGCTASTFNLRGWVEEGWTVDIQPPSLTIAAGSRARAALRVTSPASATARTYLAWASARDTATIVHNGAAGGAYTVMSGCLLMAPSMTVVPVVQSGAAGGTLVYDVTITNHDAARCAPTTFQVQSDVPADWRRVVTPSSVVVNAGQSQTVRVALTSPPGLAPSTYSLFATAIDGVNTIHAASIELSYTVTPSAVAPRPPSGLVATVNPEIKQIQLRWTGSSADAGYRIMRNGVAVGLTMSPSWTDVAWSSGDTATYYVVATDFSGRMSAPSNTAIVRLSKGR